VAGWAILSIVLARGNHELGCLSGQHLSGGATEGTAKPIKIPPLLAALLMIELGCDLRIIEAIDLGQAWRCDSAWCAQYAANWYAGWLGLRYDSPRPNSHLGWPAPYYQLRY
jgi:hypothetical protein